MIDTELQHDVTEFLRTYWGPLLIFLFLLLNRLVTTWTIEKMVREAGNALYARVTYELNHIEKEAQLQTMDEALCRAYDKWELLEYINDLRALQGLGPIQNDFPSTPTHRIGTSHTAGMRLIGYGKDTFDFVQDVRASDKNASIKEVLRVDDV